MLKQYTKTFRNELDEIYHCVMVKRSLGVKCAIKEGFTEMVTYTYVCLLLANTSALLV